MVVGKESWSRRRSLPTQENTCGFAKKAPITFRSSCSKFVPKICFSIQTISLHHLLFSHENTSAAPAFLTPFLWFVCSTLSSKVRQEMQHGMNALREEIFNMLEVWLSCLLKTLCFGYEWTMASWPDTRSCIGPANRITLIHFCSSLRRDVVPCCLPCATNQLFQQGAGEIQRYANAVTCPRNSRFDYANDWLEDICSAWRSWSVPVLTLGSKRKAANI